MAATARQPRPGSHSQAATARAAMGMAAMARAAMARQPRPGSHGQGIPPGQCLGHQGLGRSEQFSEVWSLVGLVVAKVRLPGRSQAEAGGAAPPCPGTETGPDLGKGVLVPERVQTLVFSPPSPGATGGLLPSSALHLLPGGVGISPRHWGRSPRTNEAERGHEPRGLREVDFRCKHLSPYISRFGHQVRRHLPGAALAPGPLRCFSGSPGRPRTKLPELEKSVRKCTEITKWSYSHHSKVTQPPSASSVVSLM